eukprot:scaffold58496_cov31-Tisochrysis_lutea.AAC.1
MERATLPSLPHADTAERTKTCSCDTPLSPNEAPALGGHAPSQVRARRTRPTREAHERHSKAVSERS